jgi:hypothetical protein
LPNIDFLIGGHCNLDAGLGSAAARMEKALASLGQDDRRADWQKFHDKLLAPRRDDSARGKPVRGAPLP